MDIFRHQAERRNKRIKWFLKNRGGRGGGRGGGAQLDTGASRHPPSS
jgi:hypothetical protein